MMIQVSGVMKESCIIMSVYKNDNLEYLKDAIDSLLNQTYNSFHICICKDGPLPKDIDSVLEEYNKNIDEFTLLSNKNNEGLAKSLNKLIDYVMTFDEVKYIVRMDSDDISRKNRLERQIDYINKNKLDVCGAFCREFGASYSMDLKVVPLTNKDIIVSSIDRCPFIHPTVIFRDIVFRNGLRYPEDTSFTEDMALWYKIIESGYITGNIPEVLLDYRLNEDTIIRRLGWAKGVSEFSIRYKYIRENHLLSVVSFLKVFSRLFFHFLPVPIIKYLFKNFC
ncbi:glycosyltransferase [Vibrio parahaemolyticus]|uniref:glycosyltransferase n=1 Tax=Vibrio parahaemolyticus TaxID=670 RepID=UPI001D13454E|nr:glycosyltransferase [Vibrio parahaemolyticus]